MTFTAKSDPRELSLRLESESLQRVLAYILNRSCVILLFSLRGRRRIDYFRQRRIQVIGGAVPAVVSRNIQKLWSLKMLRGLHCQDQNL